MASTFPVGSHDFTHFTYPPRKPVHDHACSHPVPNGGQREREREGVRREKREGRKENEEQGGERREAGGGRKKKKGGESKA